MCSLGDFTLRPSLGSTGACTAPASPPEGTLVRSSVQPVGTLSRPPVVTKLAISGDRRRPPADTLTRPWRTEQLGRASMTTSHPYPKPGSYPGFAPETNLT